MPKFKNKTNGAIVDVPSSPGPDWEPVAEAGSGKNRKELEINGRKVVYDYDTDEIIRDLGPADEVASRQPALTYEQQVALRNTPSRSISQSYSDPAALAQAAADRAERARQFDATYAQTETQNAKETRIAEEALAFNKKKQAYAESQDNKVMAAQAQQQAFTNQITIATLQAQRTQMQAQRDQFNAQMQQETQRANAEFQSDAQGRVQQAQRDVAQFSADPIDAGKAAAYLTSGNVFGSVGAGQQDLTSDQSLQPLAGALDAGKTAAADTRRSPYSFNPLPALGPIDTSGLTAPAPAGNSGAFDAIVAANAARGLDATGNPQVANRNDALSPIDLAALIAGDKGVLEGTSYEGAAGLPKAADGGMQQGAFIAGEAGKEIVIPLGDGQALVLNEAQQARMKPDDIKRLKKMADGGLFSGGSVFNLGQQRDTTEARQFQDDALMRALKGTPWEAGGRAGLPAPIYASSPGTSPFVAQFFAALNQTAGRLPAEEYLRQAQLLRPAGMGERAIGRSA